MVSTKKRMNQKSLWKRRRAVCSANVKKDEDEF
jgi:hypothetical protein